MLGFSIIIVTWNGLHHLKKYLPSVISTNYDNFEIIIADNNSDDGTADWIKSNYPSIKHAKLDDNYGYCGGNNRAVKFASKEILLFLNNDVEVDPNWLISISETFDKHADVGAAQPKILDYKKREYFEYAGAAGGLLDTHGYPFCRGRIFDTVEKDTGQYNDAIELFWASGAALAIKKDLFSKLNGFDEDFEFHMEEIDLCWRLQKLGYAIKFIPQSTIYHLGGGSLPMGSPRKVYYNFRNNLVMLWKNESKKNLFLIFPQRWILDIIAAFKALLSGNLSEFKAIFKSHLYFLKNFKTIHQKRKEIPSIANVQIKGRINKLLIWQYFIKKKKYYTNLIK